MSEAEYQSLIASRPVRQRTPVKTVRIQPGHYSKDLSLTVPFPPTTNHAYRVVEGLKAPKLTRAGKDFKKHVAKEAEKAALIHRWRYPEGGRIQLSLALYYPDRRKRDASNLIKLLEDALAWGLGFDDRMVEVLHVERKGIDPTNPRCEVSLTVIEGEV